MALQQLSPPIDVQMLHSSLVEWSTQIIFFVLSYFLSHLFKMMQELNHHKSACPEWPLPLSHPPCMQFSSLRVLQLLEEKGEIFCPPSLTWLLAFIPQKKQRERKGEGRVGIWEYGELSKEGKWNGLPFFPKVTLFLRPDVLLLRFKWTQQPSFVVSFASVKFRVA